MVTEEQAANAYEQVTDGCRRLVQATRDNARQWQRVKPDEELHPLAELDCEKVSTWNETLVTTPLLHLDSGRTDCIALAIQPLAPFARPTETGVAAAK